MHPSFRRPHKEKAKQVADVPTSVARKNVPPEIGKNVLPRLVPRVVSDVQL